MSKSRSASPSVADEAVPGNLPEDTAQPPENPQGAWEATVAKDVLVGKQLGDYVVKRRIGDGGMGIVYEGEHPIIGRKVAIKVLRPELTEGAQARDLIAEARAASAIRHRGIIDVFGFGTIPGVGQYLVMEFLHGTPLSDVIAKRAPMAETEAIALLDELLSALAAAHAVGVIHRDLKPGNIFVAKDSSGAESVKVLDFGLAKRSAVPNGSTPQTRASVIVGTPEYMAPEQATGQAVGPYTDLYAVGLIAFELLTRRLPFQGASFMAYVVHHMQTPPPAPSSFVPVHPELEALVLQLLAKEPAQRPASAEEVRQELKRLLPQLSESAAPGAAPTSARAAASDIHAATVMRPTPVRPTTRPPTSASSLRAASVEEPSLPATAARPSSRSEAVAEPSPAASVSAPSVRAVPVTDRIQPVPASAPIASAPSRRLGPMLAVAAVAVALGVLVGWMLRREAPAPAPVAAAPPVNVPAPPAPAPPPAPPAPAAETAVPPQASPPIAAASPEAPTQGMPLAGQPDTSAPAANEAKAKKGTLKLVMRGSGEVWVDDKKRGEVPPLNTLELPVGRHRLEIRNPHTERYVKAITITAGKTLVHRVVLKPTRPSSTKK